MPPKPKEVESALQKLGFTILRQKGSHLHLKHPLQGNRVTIPLHNQDLKLGTLYSILKQAGITLDQLNKQI